MWNPEALPPITGRHILVTGGNAGLGYFACEQLAGAGAHVIMASRSEARARSAISAIHGRPVNCLDASVERTQGKW